MAEKAAVIEVRGYKTMAVEEAEELVTALEVLSDAMADVSTRINDLFGKPEPKALSKTWSAVKVLTDWINSQQNVKAPHIPVEVMNLQIGLDCAMKGLLQVILDTNETIRVMINEGDDDGEETNDSDEDSSSDEEE